MQIEHIQNNGIGIAHITAQEPVITDTQSALDLAMSVKYETCASRIAISKDLVCGEFFILSSGASPCGTSSMSQTRARTSFLLPQGK